MVLHVSRNTLTAFKEGLIRTESTDRVCTLVNCISNKMILNEQYDVVIIGRPGVLISVLTNEGNTSSAHNYPRRFYLNHDACE